MNNFRELKVWQKSMKFTKEIYSVTSKFPKEEIYGLTSQLRKATVSIPSNIAEGAGRDTNKQFSNFINFAIGSSFEVETQVLISNDLAFISNKKFDFLMTELNHIQNMLIKLKQSLT